jgi:hypothetical protein
VAVGIAVAGVMIQVSTGGLRPTSNSVICEGPSPGAIQVSRVAQFLSGASSWLQPRPGHLLVTVKLTTPFRAIESVDAQHLADPPGRVAMETHPDLLGDVG